MFFFVSEVYIWNGYFRERFDGIVEYVEENMVGILLGGVVGERGL